MGQCFRDRATAGRQLAPHLDGYAHQPGVQVLGLARGGVPVGWAVARALHAPLAAWPVAKLGAPGTPQRAIGALAAGSGQVLNLPLIQTLQLSLEVVAAATAAAQRELTRQERLYWGPDAAPYVAGQTLILVDDGLASGVSMLAAVAALRLRAPARIVVAVPTAADEVAARVRSAADELICLQRADPFFTVDVWYQDFAPVSDESVLTLLSQAAETLAGERGRAGAEERAAPIPIAPGVLRRLPTELRCGLRPEVQQLAEQATGSAVHAALLGFFHEYPQTAMTGPDLARQLGECGPMVEEALADWVRMGLLVCWAAGGLHFYQLNRDPPWRSCLAELVAWQQTWLTQAVRLAEDVGAPWRPVLQSRTAHFPHAAAPPDSTDRQLFPW